jgi:hypothetical protein
MFESLIKFYKQVQEVNPKAVIVHCLSHRKNLATQTIKQEI